MTQLCRSETTDPFGQRSDSLRLLVPPSSASEKVSSGTLRRKDLPTTTGSFCSFLCSTGGAFGSLPVTMAGESVDGEDVLRPSSPSLGVETTSGLPLSPPALFRQLGEV